MSPHFSAIMSLVCAKAVEDAAAFFEEFGEELDPTTTDWDGEAWGGVRDNLRSAYGLDSDTLDLIWPVYSSLLVLLTHFAAETAQAA